MRRCTRSAIWYFRSLGIAGILGLVAFSASAAGLPKAAPEEVGLSPQRLQRYSEMLRAHVERGELAGAVALVARQGRVAHFEALGRMSGTAEEATAMRPDTIFGIASMTKPITSVAVMMLYEEDRLQLTDPIGRYIPELKDLKVAIVDDGQQGPDATFTQEPAARQVTVRDLLRHTSGMTYGFMDRGPVGKIYREEIEPGGGTLEDLVAKLSEVPLVTQPGARFVYGVSTDVLGYLVQVVSGQSFESFLDARIFQPLGMKDTGFYVPKAEMDRLSALYALGEDGKVHPGVRPYFRGYQKPPEAPSGGGGLVSTAEDYARFLQMLLNGGRLGDVRLLSRKSVELMTTSHFGDVPNKEFFAGYEFGLGFAVRTDLGNAGSLGSLGEYAWSGMFSTFFFVDPQEQMFSILLTQTSPFNHLDLSSRSKKLVYQAIAD